MIAIHVAQFLKEPTGSTREFDFSDPLPELSNEFELVQPVSGHANLLRTSRGILASTRYRTMVRQACGRCLEPVDVDIEGSSSDEFTPTVDVYTGHALADQPEAEELAIDEKHILDLTEVIRQDLLTRLPLHVLCDENCPGLCPDCGQDLRTGQCSCQREEKDGSPFATLAELLQREKRGRSAAD